MHLDQYIDQQYPIYKKDNWHSWRGSCLNEKFGIHFMLLQGSWITSFGLILSLIIFWLGFGSATSFFGCMILAGIGNGMVLPNANAGLLSVRPSLAGSASGIGGAIMLGGGAFFAYLAG